VSIIEEAARRLEQLRNAGISVPEGEVLRSPQPVQPNQREAGVPLRGRRGDVAEEMPGAPTNADAAPSSPARAVAKSVKIDLARLESTGIITPESPRSKSADEFRILKRPLLANARGVSGIPVARGNLIMVTSSVPGEGKSYVSVNLAMSIAMEVDSTVLLVDGDVIAPGVPHVLGLPPAKGLVDLLTDRNLDVSDVLLRTNVPRLSLLPAGTANERASELLASAAMMELLDELSSRYTDRIILFDSPPLLPSTESRVLASKMGQIVMVVEADQTPQSKVKAALATIESCPVVQLVLNKVAESELGAYYGYYGASTPQRASSPR
jgi:receptor protein-tyrosine kinase